MVLQPSDLSHAGRVIDDGYTKPSSRAVVASYTRAFGISTAGKTTFLAVESDASLIADSTAATVVVQVLKRLVRNPNGRREILAPVIQSFNQGAGRQVLQFRDFTFQRVHTLGVGDQSFIFPTTFTVKSVRFSFQMLFVRVDRVIGVLTFISLERIRPADGLMLARAIADHMRSVLAAPTGSASTGHSSSPALSGPMVPVRRTAG